MYESAIVTFDRSILNNSIGVLVFMLGHELYHFVHLDRGEDGKDARAQLVADLYGRRFAQRVGEVTEHELEVINSLIGQRRKEIHDEKREERER